MTEKKTYIEYVNQISEILNEELLLKITTLKNEILTCHNDGKKIFICGNGGSASNSTHIENDMVYGLRSKNIPNGLNIESLNSNTSVITCLANDVGYDFIFQNSSYQKHKKMIF